MAQIRQDRRSQRTQQALMDALLALLAEKLYDEISINDIVERANVGRSTFYAHYQTKDELLKSGFDRVLEMLVQHLSFDGADRDWRLDTTPLFSHAQGHYQLYRTLTWGSGSELLTRDGHAALSGRFQERLAPLLAGKPEPPVPLEVLCYALAGTLLILLKWWLDHRMPHTPERMDAMFQALAMPGARQILGGAPCPG